uniref:NADH-ubiquinone oxidoreductase chain 3 n=1 Tax=Cucullanus robustus TaxID=657293 RepID=G4V241_9BILA|nr:NADH dehydrogenase subunit 3 [Cucullanus robustus]ACV96758.1 NADH dehydrogenase subunit 3 [Cucullanus robustus]
MIFFLLLLFTLVLIFIFYLGMFILSCKDFDINKVSSFECGFLGQGKMQNSFSIHFFIIMLMFVIFDLEIVMFLGLLISSNFSVFSFLILFVFILGGFYMEWWYGKLIWIV